MFMYRGTAYAEKQTHMVLVAALMCVLCLAAADQQAICRLLLQYSSTQPHTAKGTSQNEPTLPSPRKVIPQMQIYPTVLVELRSCLLHACASLQEICYVSKALPSPVVTERHPGSQAAPPPPHTCPADLLHTVPY